MFRHAFIAIALIAAPAFAYEQPSADPTTSGKIVMYRGGSVWGAAVACPIRYRGREIVELGRGKYAEWSVQPGRYILTNKTASVEVSVDAGETRYVRCQVKTGFMSGRADLQIVDQESFQNSSNGFERKEISAITE